MLLFNKDNANDFKMLLGEKMQLFQDIKEELEAEVEEEEKRIPHQNSKQEEAGMWINSLAP